MHVASYIIDLLTTLSKTTSFLTSQSSDCPLSVFSVRNSWLTANDLMSALGAFLIFHIFDGALIGEGRLLERGTYFEILKNWK